MKVFVAGNGPSLKEVDFNQLKNIDWMGMNAAYRHWDKINIYPTYYCCLDKVVIKAHAKEILRLITEKKVEKAFLTKDILEIYPYLVKNKSVYFLEDCINLKEDSSQIFNTIYPAKKTTGSWAIRFLISLGYKKVYISGIDCNYIEIVSGASKTGKGLELKIVDDTKKNPNYFFDDYQQKDDLYQVPNPESHFGNMHLQSLEAVAQDIKLFDMDVKIYNTAKESNLYKYSVFPYMSLNELFNKPILGALCVPMIRKELDNFLSNIDLWDRVGFMPLDTKSSLSNKIDLHLLLDCFKDDELVEAVNTKINNTLYVKNIFKEVKITFLNIPDELNRYERDVNKKNVYRKIGPNTHFLMSMIQCKEYEYIFFMETDCTPLKQNWLYDINTFIENNKGFLIAGSYQSTYSEDRDSAITTHLNGNAIYATGSDDFKLFLDDVLIPSLDYLMLDKKDFHIAYDCVIAKIKTEGISKQIVKKLGGKIDDKFTSIFYNYLKYHDKLISCPLILNYVDDVQSDIINQVSNAVNSSIVSVIHNRDYNDEIIKLQKKSESLDCMNVEYKDKFLDSHCMTAGDTLYAYHYYNHRPDIEMKFNDFSRNFLLLNGIKQSENIDYENSLSVLFDCKSLQQGSVVELELKIEVSKKVLVNFKFARQFTGKYCENKQTKTLDANTLNKVFLKLKLVDAYKALRLEISSQEEFDLMNIKYKINLLESNEKKSTTVNTLLLNESKSIIRKYFKIITSNEWIEEDIQNYIVKTKNNLPNVLIIDFTLLGSNSATGQIKKTLFENWNEDQVFQVYLHGSEYRGCYPKKKNSQVFLKGIESEINKFNYDMIYFRPADRIEMFEFHKKIQKRHKIPTVTHIMDDWLKRLERTNLKLFEVYDSEIRNVLKESVANLSICKEMSIVYKERFGVEFTAVANGVDVESFPLKEWKKRELVDHNHPIIIRYMGGLEKDMSLKTVQKFSKMISNISLTLPITFEIYTLSWHIENAKKVIGKLPNVTINPLVAEEKYAEQLASSDMLLLGYNFDEETLTYLGLSFANKLPEVLSVGVPILAIGHEKIPTIAYCSELNFINTIFKEDDFNEINIRNILNDLFIQKFDANKLKKIGLNSRKYVDEKLSKKIKQNLFESFFKIREKKKKNPINLNQNSFKYANSLFRQKMYAEASEIYQALYDKHQQHFYKINLDLANNKLNARKDT